jgi:hypothetical protein
MARTEAKKATGSEAPKAKPAGVKRGGAKMPSRSRLTAINEALALHEILPSVRQLSYIGDHSRALLDTLAAKLEVTAAKAPAGRQGSGQTYELRRGDGPDPAVPERLLELRIWRAWRFDALAGRGPFFGDVCRFVQTYQMPLQGKREDAGWGRIDLVGVTPDARPAVIELKHGGAPDTLLRALVEGLAYACALRKAWGRGRLRDEWASVMHENGLPLEPEAVLTRVPVILLAPAEFWRRAGGKMREDAWPAFLELARRCGGHGYPVHFAQLDEAAEGPGAGGVINVSAVRLPGMTY